MTAPGRPAGGSPRWKPAVLSRSRGGAHTQWYEIRIRGRIGQTIRSAFPGLQALADGHDAALHGVLAEAESQGLELIEVRRIPRASPPP
jgi:hypothetical protein